MKRVVFLVERIHYYRYYVPLIEEAVLRGYGVEVWHDYSHPRGGSKGYSFPDLQLVPNGKAFKMIKKQTYKGTSDLAENIKNLKENDVLFSLRPPHFYWPHEKADLLFGWVTLQHGLDSFYDLSELPGNRFTHVFFAAYTERWLRWGKEFLESFSEIGSAVLDTFSIQVVGQPEFDTFHHTGDPDSIRKKYGIPPDKKALLYLPFPYQNWNPRSAWERAFAGLAMNTYTDKSGLLHHTRKKPVLKKAFFDMKNSACILRDKEALGCWRRGFTENAVFKTLRVFAENNDLCMVVKPRLKFPVSEYIKKHADVLVLDDEHQNRPPRLKELLSVSACAVSYYSLSVLSAAFSQIYHLNVALPPSFFPGEKTRFFFSGGEGTLFNYKGVSENLSPEQLIEQVPYKRRTDFTVDPQQRERYIKDYVGFDDCSSSKRIFGALNLSRSPYGNRIFSR